MRQHSSTDLCGGRPVTAVPTATLPRGALPGLRPTLPLAHLLPLGKRPPMIAGRVKCAWHFHCFSNYGEKKRSVCQAIQTERFLHVTTSPSQNLGAAVSFFSCLRIFPC